MIDETPIDDEHVRAICAVLERHGVRYVIIGGVAARLHATGHATVDLDVCPAEATDNVERLATALRELGCRLRVEHNPAGIPFDPHPALLTQMSTVTMVTDLGPLDLCFRPAGFPAGFDELRDAAVQISVGGLEVPVASLDDIITSKRSAGRPKDIVALPALERRQQQLRRGQDGGSEPS